VEQVVVVTTLLATTRNRSSSIAYEKMGCRGWLRLEDEGRESFTPVGGGKGGRGILTRVDTAAAEPAPGKTIGDVS
jgi:hypothetical protein